MNDNCAGELEPLTTEMLPASATAPQRTVEPARRAAWSGKRDSNPRPSAWEEKTNPRNHSHLRSSERRAAARSGISRHRTRQTAPRRHQPIPRWAHPPPGLRGGTPGPDSPQKQKAALGAPGASTRSRGFPSSEPMHRYFQPRCFAAPGSEGRGSVGARLGRRAAVGVLLVRRDLPRPGRCLRER